MNKIIGFFKDNKRNLTKSLFILFVIVFVLHNSFAQLDSVDFDQLKFIARSTSNKALFLFFILGILAVSFTSIYDFLITTYLGLRLNKFTLFNISFLANTINNLSGLGTLTGASIRVMMFKQSENKDEDVVKYNLLLIPATGIGLSIMALFSLFNFKELVFFLSKSIFLTIGFILFLIFIPVYFNLEKLFNHFSRKIHFDTEESNLNIKLQLILGSLLEWLLAFFLIYTLAIYFGYSKSIFTLLTIFSLSSIMGIVSLLPGGIGAFDLAMFIQLKSLNLAAENILAILIMYRIFYYLLPTFISIVSTLLVQSRREEKLLDFPKLKLFINKTSSLTNILLSILIFTSGTVLLLDGLFSSVMKDPSIDLSKINLLIKFSYHIQVAVGLLLLGIGSQIRHKVRGSYYTTLFLLSIGALILFTTGFSYFEALYLSLVFVLLIMSKSSFHRESVPRTPVKTFFNSTIFIIFILIYTKTAKIIFTSIIHKENIIQLEHNTALGLAISYGIPLLVYTIYQFNKKTIYTDDKFFKFEEVRFKAFLEKYPGNLMTHLGFLKDKYIFYSEKEDLLIQYEIKDDLIIVLGDPIGDMDNLDKGFVEFIKFADKYGYKTCFYEVGENFLPFYHDYGYHIFKLGETGIVKLDDFDLEGSKARDFRNILKRFAKDGYEFKIVKGQDLDDSLYLKLKNLSDAWLGNRKEMRFSLGFFDRDYIARNDIGILQDMESGKVIAFTTMMPAYDQQSISIDLMRVVDRPPNNTMIYLILNLMLHYKDLGYTIFNLGMAPLSNVGTSRKSHTGEKIAHMIFEYGNFFYGFHGLRNFKNKFKPDWEARYLIYEDISLLPHTFISITRVIHSEK